MWVQLGERMPIRVEELAIQATSNFGMTGMCIGKGDAQTQLS